MTCPSVRLRDLEAVQNADNLRGNAQEGTVAATTAAFLCTIHWLPRLRLKYMNMFPKTVTISKCLNTGHIVKGLRYRYNCSQQFLYGEQQRRSLLHAWGAQNVCSIKLLRTPWPIYPASSVLSSLLGPRSIGKIGGIHYSSVGMISSSRASALVDSRETQEIDLLWEEFFSDPSQWWDNRAHNRNSISADFNHKVTKKALWVDGLSTPVWVKARLNLATKSKLQSPTGSDTTDFEDPAVANTPPKRNNRNKNALPADAIESSLFRQRGGGNMHVHKTCTTREAVEILKHRLQQGIALDSYMYVDVLKRCLKQKDLVAAKHVHDCITTSGMDNNQYVANNLLNVYVGCGRLQDARRVFDELENKNVITWTIMIGGYAKNNLAEQALEIFRRMRKGGAQPDEITCLSVLSACTSPLALKWGKEVHTYITQAGFESDVRVGTALVNMYAKCGCMTEAVRVFEELTNRNIFTWNVLLGAYAASDSIDDARLLFNRMEKRDVITWNVMIGAYAAMGRGMEAFRLFLEMKRQGFTPNAVTYMSILNASASAGALDWVREVHDHLLKAGLVSDLRVWSALVHMYAKTGSIDDARRVFDGMEKRDVITWSAMIGGLAQHGCGHEALELFAKMRGASVKPDGTTFVAALSACCHAGLLDEGRRLFLAMSQDYGILPTVVHYTCMVDLLGRAGHLEEAKLLLDDMPVRPDGTAWGALLGACRIHGNVELGELAAQELLKLEPMNSSAYVLLSNIYAAAGKWEKVGLLRTMMLHRGVRKEPGRSWIAVDGKIHHFFVGHSSSHPEAKAIYGEMDRLTKKLKTEGYIPDTQLVLQNVDEEHKELALCSHSEKLAIVYGLMRTPPGEPVRVYKNLRVCSDCHTATKFISKVTGRVIIARDANRFHHFRDGVCSCGDYW